jgi:hypothetical protein
MREINELLSSLLVVNSVSLLNSQVMQRKEHAHYDFRINNKLFHQIPDTIYKKTRMESILDQTILLP